MGDAAQQQKTQQIDRLNQEFFDFPAADLRRDAAGQSWHAGERPGHHCQQVVGYEILIVVAAHRLIAAGLKHGEPEKNLRDDRQEPHQSAEREIAAINQPLGQSDAKNRPPGGCAGSERAHRYCLGLAISILIGVLPSTSRMILPSPARKAPFNLSICGLGSNCSTPILYFPGCTSGIENVPSGSQRPTRVVYCISAPTSGSNMICT